MSSHCHMLVSPQMFSNWLSVEFQIALKSARGCTSLTSTLTLDKLSLMGFCCMTRALSSTDASSSSVQLTPFVDLHHSSEYQPYSIQA